MRYVIILLFLSSSVFAQKSFIVFLKDKQGSKFDPFSYFDAKAIERRVKNNISLFDSTDFPVSENYIKQLSDCKLIITGNTRWFNAVFVTADFFEIEKIKKLIFVSNVEEINSATMLCASNNNVQADTFETNFLKKQIGHLQGDLFIQKGINGKGIRIAVFDGGFPGVNTHSAFQKIRDENRIIKTWDFTTNKENVYYSNSHGTNVLSCIAGMLDTLNIGLATGAEFMLAKTEVSAEPFSEEKNWLEAAEWADKNGVQIISSSLGYTDSRYFPWDMNGKKSLVSRAANIAASKGILVVNALGNEGYNNWKKIITPADADSVLSVGGIDPDTYFHINFSSYGPTADWRLKPNVLAFGHVLAANPNGGIHETDGTSFSCPLIAGFAACAWQSNPQYNNMQLFKEIEKSATLFPYFDYAHGYGIPQASYFLGVKTDVNENTATISSDSEFVYIKVKNLPPTKTNNKYLYYHIQDAKGHLKKYSVIEVTQLDVITFSVTELEKSNILRVCYLGSTTEKEF